MTNGTWIFLAAAWTMFGMMAVVALSARRRSRKIDRLMRYHGEQADALEQKADGG